MTDHIHSESCNPDNCFRAKMRHIRDHGGLCATFGSGKSPASPKWSSQQVFHESTIANEQRKMVAMNEKAGNEIEKLSARKELV